MLTGLSMSFEYWMNRPSQNVEAALQSLEGVSRVEADDKADTVSVVVDDAVTDDDLTTAIEGAGYDVAAYTGGYKPVSNFDPTGGRISSRSIRL